MRSRRLAAGALALAMAGPAFAQPAGDAAPVVRGVGGGQTAPQPTGAQRALLQACGADLHAYCPSVQPGGGRLGQCMKANWFKLSSGCKSAALAMRNAAAAR